MIYNNRGWNPQELLQSHANDGAAPPVMDIFEKIRTMIPNDVTA